LRLFVASLLGKEKVWLMKTVGSELTLEQIPKPGDKS